MNSFSESAPFNCILTFCSYQWIVTHKPFGNELLRIFKLFKAFFKVRVFVKYSVEKKSNEDLYKLYDCK